MTEILKDRYGRKIGEIIQDGSRLYIKDVYGRRLGSYDGSYTRDASGRIIGQGNLLTMLLNN